ncbi:MAG TPA: nitroreductase/quinone reductase family protein [Solirubrobacteraceae bacterium]|jgi:deazaflavin-dependent oxidoreductase (nitroreductase family)|nr:nitroreductase/quinone reductase family protein [Solirubrobacteraceae bacterium]
MTAARLPQVDPLVPANVGTRLVRRAFDGGPIGRFVIRIASDLDPFLHWWTRGRFGHLVPMPFASMTTTGARSGQPRTTAVLYFNDGDDVILIASNWGGARHPSWYHNLRAHPSTVLQRGGRFGRYVAEEVADEFERERLFALGQHVYPGFAQYRVRTAAVGRRIPIMRLRTAG